MPLAPRRGRRAYTLLEVLIALALLVCIASLALPSMLGAGERMSFEQSCEQVRAWTLSARAEAQVRGQLLELAETHAGSGRSVIILRRASRGEPTDSPPSDEWRMVLGELGPGVRAARARPVRDDGLAPEPGNEPEAPRPTRLLLLRPDGTVDDAGGFHLWSAEWRCVRATARGLTGVLDFTPVELSTEPVASPEPGASDATTGGEGAGER